MTENNMKKTRARNCLDLATMIRQDSAKKFMKVDLSLDGISGLYGRMDSKGFSIHFSPDRCLALQLPSSSKGLEEKLIPLLNMVMANSEPICTYDVVQGESEDEVRIVEWDIYNPKERLSMIKSGRVHYEGTTITRFNGEEKCIKGKRKEITQKNYRRIPVSASYNHKSSRPEKIVLEHKKQPIDRIYRDAKKVNAFEDYNELELYYAISIVGRKMQDGHNKKQAYYRMVLDKLFLQTVKFGTDLSVEKQSNHVNTTIIFRNWLGFFRNYLEKELPPEASDAFKEAFAKRESTSKFLPSTKWEDTLLPSMRDMLQKVRQNQ